MEQETNLEIEEKQEQNAQNHVALPKEEEILFETDVNMNAKVLYDYMLRHTYYSMMGLVATIIGVLFIFMFVKGYGVIYLCAGIFVIGYLPWNNYLSAKRQSLTNEAFKKPLHYTFTKDGIYVSQNETVQMQKWEDMYQAVSTPRSIIVYTSKVNASIFPKADLGDKTAVLIEVISKHMEPKKVKIRQ